MLLPRKPAGLAVYPINSTRLSPLSNSEGSHHKDSLPMARNGNDKEFLNANL